MPHLHPPIGAALAELLRVLMLPDFDRADAIQSNWANPKTRAFAELKDARRLS